MRGGRRRAFTAAVVLAATGAVASSAQGAKSLPSIYDPQFVPTGVQRIGANLSPTAKIDGIDERVDVDVAVIDSGVDANQPDLNVVGCVNLQKRVPRTFGCNDDLGHGTHIAGTIGALDNSIGVVGVAPGARIWAIKTLNKNGTGENGREIRAFNWVADHADTIEVVNLSGGIPRTNDRFGDTSPGSRLDRKLRRAIQRAVNAGVTVVSVAGNESQNVRGFAPGAYSKPVITVSGLSDTDGKPGGGGPKCNAARAGRDNTFASFSNFGSRVDIAAPAVCNASTVPGGVFPGDPRGLIFEAGGTSSAAPHVAGVAALYLANHPNASPAEVRNAIVATRERRHMKGDPDRWDEGIVNARPF